ncbi:MAG: hypothetical protein JW732_01025 [Dehalococcoidia bacterium]|nr:hypothetical protein [Dehalococcoidia bacterium]
MTVKGKRAHITLDGKSLIIARSLESPPMQRTKLAESLQTEFEALGYDIPEIEVLERKISWYRNHAEGGTLEKPWSMAVLNNYRELNIESPTPEALLAVLKVWKLRIAQELGFTIREAKWAARLSRALEDIKNLSRYASRYARLELIYQLIGRPFNTTQLDKEIMTIPYSITSKDGPEGLLPLLARQEDAVNQIRNLKQGKSEGITIGKEQPPDESLTKEQILQKSAKIRKRILKHQKKWEDYKREVHNEGAHNQEG